MKARSFTLAAGLLGVCLALSPVMSTPVIAEEPSTPNSVEAVDELANLLSRATTFQAQFVQFIADKNGAIQQTSGTLKARKPGYFFWHTDPPLEQVIVSDGNKVQVYDPDLEQVTVQQMDDQKKQSPAMLLSGDVEKIRVNYQVSREGMENIQVFSLVPVSNESLFDRLQLKFIDQTLVEMRLRDGLGQKTTLSFLNVIMNPVFTDADFQLQLPDGVDIIAE